MSNIIPNNTIPTNNNIIPTNTIPSNKIQYRIPYKIPYRRLPYRIPYKTLEYHIPTNRLSIKDRINIMTTTESRCIQFPYHCKEMYIMKIKGKDDSNIEFRPIDKAEYYNILKRYISEYQFEIDDILYDTYTYTSDKYTVLENETILAPNLYTFSLYHIYKTTA